MSRVFIWVVRGMHCASCERTITQVLQQIDGVQEVEVSLKQKRAGIRLGQGAISPDLDKLNQQLSGYGYTLSPQVERDDQVVPVASGITCDVPRKSSRPLSQRVLQGLGLVLLVALGSWLVVRPLTHLVPQISVQGSLLALFGFGMIASVSTCLASTGAFLLAYSAQQTKKHTLLWLHLGRLAAFALGGAILGLVGSALPSLYVASGLITLGLGIGFLWVGLHFLELAPSLSSLGLHLPSRLNRVSDRVTHSSSAFAPFLVGAVTFLLPCGFTQTAQALALASGSAWRGALLLSVYALGTVPVLAGISRFGSLAALRQHSLRLATGAILVLFAFGQIDGGLTVLGSSVTVGGILSHVRAAVVRSVQPSPVQAQEQIVNMTVAYGAFTPNRFTVRAGIPVRWQVKGVDISGCASSIIAPKIGLNRNLHLGLNEIQFTPNETGVIPFSCSMGMIRGSFVVVR